MKLFSCIAIVALVGCLVAFKPFLKKDTPAVKKIYLMRHADASPADSTMTDFDRPLEASGKVDAAETGEYLSPRETGTKIDLVIASPALRTRQTTEIVCEKIGYDFRKVKWDSTIYLCSVEALENCIRGIDEKYTSVLIIGHNNSMTIVADRLQSGKENIGDMPTAAVAGISFNVSAWTEVKPGTGKRFMYARPLHPNRGEHFIEKEPGK